MAHLFQNSKFKIQDSYRGFTLIESLVFLFLFMVISLVFFQTYAVGTRLIIESKNRLGATALANQKMEIIRSVDYDAIGTTTGIPSGDLLENETISVNTVRYNVHTFVQYVDDDFDSTVATGDVIPTDYKRVRLTVSWGNQGSDQSVIIFGNFSPKGVETAGAGGVLSINALDGTGAGVAGVNVHIVNGAAGVNINATTDSTGNVMLPGSPAGAEAYTLTVSKAGHYGATTYPSYPTSSFNPIDVHASVVAGVLNQTTIVIEESSDITLTTKDPFGTSVSGVDYTVEGGRIFGTDPVTGTIYGLDTSGTTDGSGEAEYPDESAGQYLVGITDADYQFYKTSPESALLGEFTALAGVATPVDIIVLDTRIGSLKVKVESQADGSALAGASVKLINVSLAYDTTVTTDQYGYAYFPTALPALVPATYDMEVTLLGYDTENSSVVIGATLVTDTVQMTAE